MNPKYEPASEPLHISVRWWFQYPLLGLHGLSLFLYDLSSSASPPCLMASSPPQPTSTPSCNPIPGSFITYTIGNWTLFSRNYANGSNALGRNRIHYEYNTTKSPLRFQHPPPLGVYRVKFLFLRLVKCCIQGGTSHIKKQPPPPKTIIRP